MDKFLDLDFGFVLEVAKICLDVAKRVFNVAAEELEIVKETLEAVRFSAGVGGVGVRSGRVEVGWRQGVLSGGGCGCGSG